MEQIVTGDEFVQKWAAALGEDPAECRRIVIDAQAGHVLIVHVEKLGTERMLEVDPPDPSSVDVRHVDRTEEGD